MARFLITLLGSSKQNYYYTAANLKKNLSYEGTSETSVIWNHEFIQNETCVDYVLLVIVKGWVKLLCQKITYATYLLLMAHKNFLRYDNRDCTTHLQ